MINPSTATDPGSPAHPDLDDGVPTDDTLTEPEDAEIAHTGGIGDLQLGLFEQDEDA